MILLYDVHLEEMDSENRSRILSLGRHHELEIDIIKFVLRNS